MRTVEDALIEIAEQMKAIAEHQLVIAGMLSRIGEHLGVPPEETTLTAVYEPHPLLRGLGHGKAQ